ncbi:NAD(P)H-binding protein [Paenibacillus sp. JX-17]|uniref:NAD(P)H-binding protein n=1 Tax=Paenibacillus lacisoli TaxID=3064525 RepID=A0ABT9CBP0_9BACL|nr:NAD(P)H-binding protein [Paenibacillus sp. JX-17]MDO7906678.1 NAD(P)H-binding protein [Paenibacillus sp. JX-17]
MGMRALVIGATGLTGGFVVRELLASDIYEQVTVVVRRPLDVKHHKLNQIELDWERIETAGEEFQGVDDLFSCMGTTIKQAGSREQFRKVDLEYPRLAARLAYEHGARQLLAISAMGADASSRIFYNRVKGEAEQSLMDIGYPSLHLFRPSLLLGKRDQRRAGEEAGAVVMRALDPILKRWGTGYRAMPASILARAMVRVAATRTGGTHVYPNDIIRVIGEG